MAGKSPLGQQLDSIYETKQDLLELHGKIFLKEYVPFVINKCVAKHVDTIFYAQDMNRLGDVPKDMHYEYMLHSIRRKKRFAKSIKIEENPDIEVIKRHYKYNTQRAMEALAILSDETIQDIRKQYNEQ